MRVKTTNKFKVSVVHDVLEEPPQRSVMARLPCRSFACQASGSHKQVWPAQASCKEDFHQVRGCGSRKQARALSARRSEVFFKVWHPNFRQPIGSSFNAEFLRGVQLEVSHLSRESRHTPLDQNLLMSTKKLRDGSGRLPELHMLYNLRPQASSIALASCKNEIINVYGHGGPHQLIQPETGVKLFSGPAQARQNRAEVRVPQSAAFRMPIEHAHPRNHRVLVQRLRARIEL